MTDNKSWLAELKPGDKVIVCRWPQLEEIAVVDKVTPTGIIRLVGSSATYSNRGRERGRDHNFGGPPQLEQYTPEAAQRVRKKNMINRLCGLRSYDYQKFSYDQIRDAYRALFPIAPVAPVAPVQPSTKEKD